MSCVTGELVEHFVFGHDDRNHQSGFVMLPFELVTIYFLFGRLCVLQLSVVILPMFSGGGWEEVFGLQLLVTLDLTSNCLCS